MNKSKKRERVQDKPVVPDISTCKKETALPYLDFGISSKPAQLWSMEMV